MINIHLAGSRLKVNNIRSLLGGGGDHIYDGKSSRRVRRGHFQRSPLEGDVAEPREAEAETAPSAAGCWKGARTATPRSLLPAPLPLIFPFQ